VSEITEGAGMLQLAENLRVVDADSHVTERHDLFTERAPKCYGDKVHDVEHIDGRAMWVIEGDELGIDVQVLYPNSIGLGGQNLWNTVADPNAVTL